MLDALLRHYLATVDSEGIPRSCQKDPLEKKRQNKKQPKLRAIAHPERIRERSSPPCSARLAKREQEKEESSGEEITKS